ncbi:collagen, type I, alpha 1b-like isoform X1 [Chroicocephalus ridibundus]|uniref:collagen, type I, alpha 1b-like isoform X1 n=1 Tax=Chroicocephalus ridibundus TaxID=1192867 RepID=UPI002FDDFE0C
MPSGKCSRVSPRPARAAGGGDYITHRAPRGRSRRGWGGVGGARGHVRARGWCRPRRAMAESAPEPRGPNGSGSAAGPRSPLPRDAAGDGSDGGSETPTSSVTPTEEEEEEEGHQWRVGDACRTAWPGDGRLYPARLRALDPGTGTCLVQFDGYGDTEERALADLLPPDPATWGASDTLGGEGPPSSWEPPPGARRRKGEQPPSSPQPPEVMPPPWPPALLHAMREEEEEEEALAAMLMAWASGKAGGRLPSPPRGRAAGRRSPRAVRRAAGSGPPAPHRRGSRGAAPCSCSPLACGGSPPGVLAARMGGAALLHPGRLCIRALAGMGGCSTPFFSPLSVPPPTLE